MTRVHPTTAASDDLLNRREMTRNYLLRCNKEAAQKTLDSTLLIGAARRLAQEFRTCATAARF